MKGCFFLLFIGFFRGCFPAEAWAQSDYGGLRLAVFEVQILQQKKDILTLRCRMANTGRKPLSAQSNTPELRVELDTSGLPMLLQGFESLLAQMAREQCPPLQVGEISAPIWLKMRFTTRAWEGLGTCAAVVFDTAFVEKWDKNTMRIRYVIRNTGDAPARLFAKKTEPLIQVFFVRGTQRTRGAIPAGNTQIRLGRESLDGLLFPGQRLSGTVEIPLRDRTRFSPNIALEFDPAQVVDECGRTDNIWVIPLRF